MLSAINSVLGKNFKAKYPLLVALKQPLINFLDKTDIGIFG